MQIFLSSLTMSHVQRSHLEIAPDVWKQMATDRDIKAVMGETDYISPPPSFDWNTEKGRAAKSPVHIQISSSSSRESHFKFCQISTMTQICHDVLSSAASSCLDTAMLMKKMIRVKAAYLNSSAGMPRGILKNAQTPLENMALVND